MKPSGCSSSRRGRKIPSSAVKHIQSTNTPTHTYVHRRTLGRGCSLASIGQARHTLSPLLLRMRTRFVSFLRSHTDETRGWCGAAFGRSTQKKEMGGGVSVDVDASVLRKEYETLAAKNVSDEELLNHMKKLIVSPQTGEASTRVFFGTAVFTSEARPLPVQYEPASRVSLIHQLL